MQEHIHTQAGHIGIFINVSSYVNIRAINYVNHYKKGSMITNIKLIRVFNSFDLKPVGEYPKDVKRPI